jgi:hypothetical protein
MRLRSSFKYTSSELSQARKKKNAMRKWQEVIRCAIAKAVEWREDLQRELYWDKKWISQWGILQCRIALQAWRSLRYIFLPFQTVFKYKPYPYYFLSNKSNAAPANRLIANQASTRIRAPDTEIDTCLVAWPLGIANKTFRAVAARPGVVVCDIVTTCHRAIATFSRIKLHRWLKLEDLVVNTGYTRAP